MNKVIVSFLVFLFGIMAGYAWQGYHHKLLVGDLRETITDNQKRINEMRGNIDELETEFILNEVIQKVIYCESNGKHNAIGDGGKAYGPAQFHEKTFNWMKELAGRPHYKWKNTEHQIWLLKWAIKNGYGNHWTCYQNMQIEDKNL